MIGAAYTCAHQGVDTYLVRAEARVTPGVPKFVIVGLPDSAVREGKERVRSALREHLGKALPERITVNLSPASRRKSGAGCDLAVALAVLVASERIDAAGLAGTVLLGELGLDGRLRAVAGVLPATIEAGRRGFRRIIVPRANASEAGLVDGIDAYSADNLDDAVGLIAGGYQRQPVNTDGDALLAAAAYESSEDLAQVRGQRSARRALEIAAAGRHHLLMIGPPGAGKTMLARRLPTILPPLTLAEAIEATSIHSIAGLSSQGGLVTRRPFRAPHHTASGVGMVGGGPQLRPGEISLAHNGVLFLDELPEFAPHVLNQLREPLEDGFLTISRALGQLTFPARVVLVAAMNPCPCGYYGSRAHPCQCLDTAVVRYRARVSGPLLDRIDLHVNVPRLEFAELGTSRASEPSSTVRERVLEAAALRARLPRVDAQTLAEPVRKLLARASERLALSARSVGRVVSIAATIACLAGRTEVSTGDLAEALQYRPDPGFDHASHLDIGAGHGAQ